MQDDKFKASLSGAIKDANVFWKKQDELDQLLLNRTKLGNEFDKSSASTYFQGAVKTCETLENGS